MEINEPEPEVTDENCCHGCAAASEKILATVTVSIEDEGNGWQTHRYCESCDDALGYSDGNEISLDDPREEE